MTELQMLAVAYLLFTLLIVLEIAVSLYKADGGYRLGEVIVNVGHGIVYQVFDYLTKGVVALPFLAAASLVSWELLPIDAWWAWLIGVLAYDFCSYWSHRHQHEIHGLWAIHGTHHAAEDFNLAAALRQPAFQRIFAWVWRLPLVFIAPIEMLITLVVFDFLYQFIQHTRYVGKLGPIHWIMNTPAHHRVHHGRQEKYLDKNYVGIFIIWDRMFGTFQVEEEEPEYGVTKPLSSLNAVWGNLAIFEELIDASRATTGSNRLWLWWEGPGALEALAPAHRYQAPPTHVDGDVPLPIRVYVVVTGPTIPLFLGYLLLMGDGWPVAGRVAACVLVVLSVVLAGALLEQKRWANPVEGARLAGLSAAACIATGQLWPAVLGVILLSGFAAAVTTAEPLPDVHVGT